jgi:hypothetical protein
MHWSRVPELAGVSLGASEDLAVESAMFEGRAIFGDKQFRPSCNAILLHSTLATTHAYCHSPPK